MRRVTAAQRSPLSQIRPSHCTRSDARQPFESVELAPRRHCSGIRERQQCGDGHHCCGPPAEPIAAVAIAAVGIAVRFAAAAGAVRSLDTRRTASVWTARIARRTAHACRAGLRAASPASGRCVSDGQRSAAAFARDPSAIGRLGAAACIHGRSCIRERIRIEQHERSCRASTRTRTRAFLFVLRSLAFHAHGSPAPLDEQCCRPARNGNHRELLFLHGVCWWRRWRQ